MTELTKQIIEDFTNILEVESMSNFVYTNFKEQTKNFPDDIKNEVYFNLLETSQNRKDDTYIHLTNLTTGATSSNGVTIGLDASQNLILWNRENTSIRFGTNNTEVIRLDANGNLGINDTAPGHKLDVNGDINTTGVYKIDDTNVFDSNTTLTSTVVASSLTSVGTLSSLNITDDLTVGTSVLSVDVGTVEVGIGIDNPTELLHLRKDQNDMTTLYLVNSTNGTAACSVSSQLNRR